MADPEHAGPFVQLRGEPKPPASHVPGEQPASEPPGQPSVGRRVWGSFSLFTRIRIIIAATVGLLILASNVGSSHTFQERSTPTPTPAPQPAAQTQGRYAVEVVSVTGDAVVVRSLPDGRELHWTAANDQVRRQLTREQGETVIAYWRRSPGGEVRLVGLTGPHGVIDPDAVLTPNPAPTPGPATPRPAAPTPDSPITPR